MLHAFNQKNARRIFERSNNEHTNNMTEDAVTSMVFSPLAFMTASDALNALVAIVGQAHADVVAGRTAKSHDLSLWPTGLSASQWHGDSVSGCTPDLMAIFEFGTGPPAIFIGEMKWDWSMKGDELDREIARQQEAVRGARPDADQIRFVIAKRRPALAASDVLTISWIEVANRLGALERSRSPGPCVTWARLVGAFLDKADVRVFQEFSVTKPSDSWSDNRAFWRGAS